MRILHNQWIICGNSDEQVRVIKEILCFLEPEFYKIFNFGSERFESCTIFNNESSACPMLITNQPNLYIMLSMNDINCWAQMIYQLSHEMCHYYIRQFKDNKEIGIKWLEETICEAISLYMLSYAVEDWSNCSLSSNDSNFNEKINSYLDVISRIKTEKRYIMECKTVKDLEEFNVDSEKDRSKRHYERNTLYKIIRLLPKKCHCFLHYTNYVSTTYPELLVDFIKWKQVDDNILIEILSLFQPDISVGITA